jgi:hypothetical protein
MLRYRFLIEGNGKRREVFILEETPVKAEQRLKAALELDNKRRNRETKIIKFVGI